MQSFIFCRHNSGTNQFILALFRFVNSPKWAKNGKPSKFFNSVFHSGRMGRNFSKIFCKIFWSQNVRQVLTYPMKHILYFFDARKGSRIDLFSARSDIYVVNFDLFVFIEGVIFQKDHRNIKVAVQHGDSRFQRFFMISSHLHRNFQF